MDSDIMTIASEMACEYTRNCEAYYEVSWTCTKCRDNCRVHELFATGQIKEFKVPGLEPEKRNK